MDDLIARLSLPNYLHVSVLFAARPHQEFSELVSRSPTMRSTASHSRGRRTDE
jgi:hypothetical protein